MNNVVKSNNKQWKIDKIQFIVVYFVSPYVLSLVTSIIFLKKSQDPKTIGLDFKFSLFSDVNINHSIFIHE